MATLKEEVKRSENYALIGLAVAISAALCGLGADPWGVAIGGGLMWFGWTIKAIRMHWRSSGAGD